MKARKEIVPSRIIASLTFRFWTAMWGGGYEMTLWRKALHRCFPHAPKPPKRSAINSTLTPIRMLRNRIAHQEPILSLNLAKHYGKAIDSRVEFRRPPPSGPAHKVASALCTVRGTSGHGPSPGTKPQIAGLTDCNAWTLRLLSLGPVSLTLAGLRGRHADLARLRSRAAYSEIESGDRREREG